MARRYLPVCCTFLLIQWLTGCSADDRLAFKPRLGKNYNLSIDITDWEVHWHAGDTVFRIKHRYDLTLRLRRRDRNRYVMDVTIDSISITQPRKNIEPQDSSILMLEAAPPFSLTTNGVAPDVEKSPFYVSHLKDYYQQHVKLFTRLKGEKLQVVMDHKGLVKEVLGVNAFTRRLFSGIVMDGNVADYLLKVYKPGNFMTDLLNNAFFFLPGQPVEKGEEWLRYLEKTTRYTGLRYYHRLFAVDISKERIELSVLSELTNWWGEEGQTGGAGEMSGIVTVDPSTGMPLKAELEQSYEMKMEDYRKDVVKKRSIIISTYSP